MKLFYFANKFFPGKSANSVQIMEMCEAFKNNNIDITLVGFKSKEFRGMENLLKSYGIKNKFNICLLEKVPTYYLREIKLFFYFLMNRDKIDFIYTRSLLFSVFVKLFFRKKKLIYELHDLAKSILFKIFLKNSAKLLDYIVVISKRLKKELKAKYKITNVVCLPDGVSIRKFNINISKKTARKKLRLPINKYLVFYIGSFHRWKGIYTFLESEKYLDKKLKKKILYVVVGGKSKQEIENFKNLYKNIFFVGYVEHNKIPIYLKAADILVLPNSAKEKSANFKIAKYYTSPLKLFEYMCARRPIIASNLPSIREILNENNSVLVEPDNPKILAKGIEEIIKNKNLRKKIVKQGFIDVKQFSWDRRASKIINLYY